MAPRDEPPHCRYTTLGVSPFASFPDIRKAFNRLALIHHPDKAKAGSQIDGAKFREVDRPINTLQKPR